MQLSRKVITLLVIVFLLVIVGLNAIMSRNKMVSMEEKVISQWAQVENVYQRRSDLIPNIVAVAKKYAEHERATLEAVVAARAKATQVTVNVENLSDEEMQKFQAAQNNLSSALGRLLAVSESYPDLKANENFAALITELEGSENRITRERQVFNEYVKEYNTAIRKFPRNIWAGIFGFERKALFKMKEGADQTPNVEDLLNK